MNSELRTRADLAIGSFRVSDAAKRRTRLMRSGGEWKGICPFHHEKTPSFTVNDAKGFYHCFGCGAHGDVIRFVMETERVGFIHALAMIDGGELPRVPPEEMARIKDVDAALDVEKVRWAKEFWDRGVDVAGTPADAYLSSRLIRTRPDTLRFARVPAWRDEETGQWGPEHPALLLKAETLAGEFAGIQRIFLTPDGRKHPMRAPKRTLGGMQGIGVRFGFIRTDAIVTGSPEDGLTLYQRFNEMVTVVVSCGEAMMPFLRLSSRVERVSVARQNDKPGMIAARKAVQAFREQGKIVREIAPAPAFKDWNDEERGFAMQVAA